MSTYKIIYRYRSAITGEFVSKAYADKHPNTTYLGKVLIPISKRKRKH